MRDAIDDGPRACDVAGRQARRAPSSCSRRSMNGDPEQLAAHQGRRRRGGRTAQPDQHRTRVRPVGAHRAGRGGRGRAGGRRMNDLFDLLDDDARDRLEREDLHIPGAMLATLTDDHFADPNWIYERKLDGQRVLAAREDGRARLRSRNDLDLDDTYPELVDALSGDGPGPGGRRRGRGLRGQRHQLLPAAAAHAAARRRAGPRLRREGAVLPLRRHAPRRLEHPRARRCGTASGSCVPRWTSTTRCGSRPTATRTGRASSRTRADAAGRA